MIPHAQAPINVSTAPAPALSQRPTYLRINRIKDIIAQCAAVRMASVTVSSGFGYSSAGHCDTAEKSLTISLFFNLSGGGPNYRALQNNVITVSRLK
jgi:hypothetical protein